MIRRLVGGTLLGVVLAAAVLMSLAAGYGRQEAGSGPVDAVIVLGAGVRSDGTLGPAARARVARGVALMEAGLARTLIVTDSPNAAPAMAREARRLGLAEARLRVEGRARSTLQNALYTAPMVAGQRVILVTEGLHMARARASFAWAGVAVERGVVSTAYRDSAADTAAMLMREVLAWPYNVARVALWHVAGVLGVETAARLPYLD